MLKRMSDRVAARVNAAKQVAKSAGCVAVVYTGFAVQQAQAALDQTTFDTEITGMKADINYAGQAFLFVSVAVAVWLWIRRAAK